MSTHDDFEAKCPYYKKADAQKIYCEGLEENSNLCQFFRNGKAKRDFKGMYCDMYYTLCPIYRMKEKDYEDE